MVDVVACRVLVRDVGLVSYHVGEGISPKKTLKKSVTVFDELRKSTQ
jgi:hypothetical protein